jgi:molybdopterin converting factor small subunit
VTVTVHLPGPLRPFNEGRGTLALDGPANVEQALNALPVGVRDRILNERGELRPHVNVFVGDTSVRETGGLATPLQHGALVFVIPAVSGGSGPTPATTG